MRRTKSHSSFFAALVGAAALTWAVGLPTALAQPKPTPAPAGDDEIEMDGDDQPAGGVDEGEIEMDGDTAPEPDLSADLAADTSDAVRCV